MKRMLREKRICGECCIIFEKTDECPRCGKSDKIQPYFDLSFLKE